MESRLGHERGEHERQARGWREARQGGGANAVGASKGPARGQRGGKGQLCMYGAIVHVGQATPLGDPPNY